MDTDVVAGCILSASAMLLTVYFVLWSRKTIDRISRRGLRSARDIIREIYHGR
jgi:hypothetical protein